MLIHIGFPKTGSSYLQGWFDAHPRMYYQNHAITGFYHSHDIARYAESTDPIHDCFVLSSEDLSVWKGEVDIVGVKYARFYDVKAYHAKLSETLHRIYPQAKMLIVTRGYISYFSSLYAQYISSGGALSFEVFHERFGSLFPVAYDITHIVTQYRQVMGDENVIVLPYELLNSDPQTFTKLIEHEVGITENFTGSKEKVNPSFDKKILATYLRVSNLLVRLISPLPYKIQAKIYGFYVHKLNQKRPHPVMRFLARFTKKDIEMKGMEILVDSLKGRSEILRNEKLYQPYLKEYLL